MINMDAPRHTKLRLIVNRGFTPRMINQLEDYVGELAAKIVDHVAPKGEIDFVEEVAARLPLDIICQMMGIPEEDEQFIFERTNIAPRRRRPRVRRQRSRRSSRRAGSCGSTRRSSARTGWPTP